jgi:hypothetical protein
MMRQLVPAVALLALAAADIFTPLDTGLVEAPAHAVIGRPVTPVSYAGVARRTTRRVVYGTAVATSAATAQPTTTVVYVEQPPAQPAAPAQQPAPPPPK